MSLFGTGRREGVIAALGLCAIALAVHAIGAATGLSDGFEGDRALASGMATAHRLVAAGELPLWDPAGAGAPLWARGAALLYPPWWLLGRGDDAFWLPALAALHAALACALGFRFLRAHGRSRYAAFVCGAAYGLGAQVGCLGGHLPELAALAFAPLGLEVFLRIARGERQRHLTAWLGPALALPFWTGGAVTATASALLVGLWLCAFAVRERERRARLLTTLVVTAAVTALLTAPIWLGQLEVPPSSQPSPPRVDLLASLRRIVGPLLLFLGVLGAMRRQREAPTGRWLLLAVVGAALAVLLPTLPSPWPRPAPWQLAPLALWWPVHLALVLLASNGLDDFLSLPQRRRTATAWALLSCTLATPVGFWLGASDAYYHVEAAVLLALALLFATWRHLGILGFKTVIAAAALVWLAIATLHEQAGAVRDPAPVPRLLATAAVRTLDPAAPQLETAPPLLPPRARLSFDLKPAGAATAPLPAPLSGTRVIGLPTAFAPVVDQAAAVKLRREGATWSEYALTLPVGRGALVIADTHSPGWLATVDGRPAPVLRTDRGERAVLVGHGARTVRFDYRPLAWSLGRWLALGAGTIAGLVGLVASLRRWSALRKAARGRRKIKVRRPPTAAKPAIATNASGALRS